MCTSKTLRKIDTRVSAALPRPNSAGGAACVTICTSPSAGAIRMPPSCGTPRGGSRKKKIDHSVRPISGQNSQAIPVSAASKVMKAKMAMKRQPSSRIGTKKLASIQSVDLGDAEHLAWIDQIGIADLILVRAVDQNVVHAMAVVSARDVPQVVALHHHQPAPLAGGRHDDALERQFETRHGSPVFGQAIEPELVFARSDGIGGLQTPASIDACLAFGHHPVVNVGAHHGAGGRLPGDGDLTLLIVVESRHLQVTRLR